MEDRYSKQKSGFMSIQERLICPLDKYLAGVAQKFHYQCEEINSIYMFYSSLDKKFYFFFINHSENVKSFMDLFLFFPSDNKSIVSKLLSIFNPSEGDYKFYQFLSMFSYIRRTTKEHNNRLIIACFYLYTEIGKDVIRWSELNLFINDVVNPTNSIKRQNLLSLVKNDEKLRVEEFLSIYGSRNVLNPIEDFIDFLINNSIGNSSRCDIQYRNDNHMQLQQCKDSTGDYPKLSVCSIFIRSIKRENSNPYSTDFPQNKLNRDLTTLSDIARGLRKSVY